MCCIHQIDQAITRAEKGLALVANVMLFSIMMIVTLDVGLRYIFGAPLDWSYELISLYLMVGLFFFSLSDTLRNNQHVAVDLLLPHLPQRVVRTSLMLVYALSTAVFGLATYVGVLTTYQSYVAKEALLGVVAWPTWLSTIAVPIGLAVFTLRMAFRTLGHGLSLLSNTAVIPLDLDGSAEGAHS